MKKILVFLGILLTTILTMTGFTTYARIPNPTELRSNSLYSYIDSSIIYRGPGDEWYDGYVGLKNKGLIQENKLVVTEDLSLTGESIPNVDLIFDDENYGFPLQLFNMSTNAPLNIRVHYFYYLSGGTWYDDNIDITIETEYTYLQLYDDIYNYSGDFDICRISKLDIRATESYSLVATDYSNITDSYNNGYNNGYQAGYDDGESDGYQTGYIDGESDGYNDGLSSNIEENGFYNLINNIISFPINMLKTVFNFEIFGINISGLILFIISLGIVAFVIRLLSGGGKNE